MAKPIKIEILGDAKSFRGALTSSESGIKKIGKSLGRLALGFGGLALAAGAGLAALGNEFNEANSKIRIGTGATGEDLAGLNEDFKNLARTVPASFDDASTAIADLNTRLGLTGEPLVELSGKFINLSRITGTDVAGNVDRVTRVFGDWNVAAEDQAEVMDKLFRASQNSGIGIDELASSLVQSGAPLRNMGFTLEESSALLAKFNKEGVNSETVIAGMKIGVANLAKDGEDIPETFSRIISEIERLGPSSEATGLAMELFGSRAGPDLADAISGGKFQIDDMLSAIENGSDTIDKAAADTENFKEKWLLFKNNVLIGLQPLATKLFDALGRGTEQLILFFNALRSGQTQDEGTPIERLALLLRAKLIPAGQQAIALFRQYGPVVKGIVVAAFKALTPVLMGVWDALKEGAKFVNENREVLLGFAAIIVVAFTSWAVSAGAAAVATLAAAAPLIALGVAVGALAFLIRKLYRENETFRRIVDRVVGAIRQNFMPGLRMIRDFIQRYIIPVLKAAGDKAWSWIKIYIEVQKVVFRVVKAIVGKLVEITPTLFRIGKKVRSLMIKPFTDGINLIRDAWNRLKRLLSRGVSIPNPFSGFNLPGFAMGTSSAPGGVFKVGERGPENVILPRGARVQPAHMSQGSSGGDTFVFQGSNLSVGQVMAESAWARRNGNGR